MRLIMAAHTDPLLIEIKKVIAAAGVSRTKFGYLVASDPALLPKMERGRLVKKQELRVKIEAELKRLRGLVAERALG